MLNLSIPLNSTLCKVDSSGCINLSVGNLLPSLWREEELVGRTMEEVFASIPKVLTGFEQCLNGNGCSLRREIDRKYYQLDFLPLFDDQLHLSGAVCIALTSDLEPPKILETKFFEDLHLTDDDPKLLDAIIMQANRSLEKCLHQLDQSIQSMRFKNIKRDVHALRSSVVYLGGSELSDWCRILEVTAESRDPFYINKTYANVSSSFERFILAFSIQFPSFKSTENNSNKV